MIFSVEFFIYLVTGIAVLALYYLRRKGLEGLTLEVVPELDKAEFLKLKSLLATAYDRALYLGVSFLVLAFAVARASDIKAFCVLLTAALFLFNIPPRHKAMKLLASAGVDLKSIRERGINI